MSTHYGDFPVNDPDVVMVFDTFAAATGAPTATTNFASGDIQIYKDGGTAQRSSSAGISVITSFDANTGLQLVNIDLSDNTDAGFYAAGHEYQVAVADITADGQTLRFWLGTFSIERPGGVLALLKGGAVKVDVNTIKTNPVVNGGTVTFPTTATLASTTGAVGSVTGAVGSLTTNNDKTGYALSAAAVQAIWDALTSALTTVGSVGKRVADFLTGDAYVRIGAAGAGLTALGDTRIANLDALVSSRLATSGYTVPPTANANADAHLDRADAIETGITERGALRLILAALAGKLSGAATTTVTIRNVGDTKNRLVASVDADGNRSAVTTDAT